MRNDGNGITEILAERLNGDIPLTEILHDSSNDFIQIELCEYLSALIRKRNMGKNLLIRESGINKRYFFDILSGKRQPARDYVLRILIALKLSCGDIQWLLKAAGYPQLYPRDRRDCVIIYCLNHGIGVSECNGMLIKIGMDTL